MSETRPTLKKRLIDTIILAEANKEILQSTLGFTTDEKVEDQLKGMGINDPYSLFLIGALADHSIDLLCAFNAESYVRNDEINYIFCEEEDDQPTSADDFFISKFGSDLEQIKEILNKNGTITGRKDLGLEELKIFKEDQDWMIEFPNVSQASLIDKTESMLTELVSISDGDIKNVIEKSLDEDNTINFFESLLNQESRLASFAYLEEVQLSMTEELGKLNPQSLRSEASKVLSFLTPFLEKMIKPIQESFLSTLQHLYSIQNQSIEIRHQINSAKFLLVNSISRVEDLCLNNTIFTEENLVEEYSLLKENREKLKNYMIQLDILNQLYERGINVVNDGINTANFWLGHPEELDKIIGIYSFSKTENDENHDLFLSDSRFNFKGELFEKLNQNLGEKVKEIFKPRELTDSDFDLLFKNIQCNVQTIVEEEKNKVDRNSYNLLIANKEEQVFKSIPLQFRKYINESKQKPLGNRANKRLIGRNLKIDNLSFFIEQNKKIYGKKLTPKMFQFIQEKAKGFTKKAVNKGLSKAWSAITITGIIQCIMFLIAFPEILTIFRDSFCENFGNTEDGFFCGKGSIGEKIVENSVNKLKEIRNKIMDTATDIILKTLEKAFFSTPLGIATFLVGGSLIFSKIYGRLFGEAGEV